MEYTTKGTCSRKILFEVEDGKVHNVQFVGGCNGNTQGVARLVEGMDVNEAISRMKGIDCPGECSPRGVCNLSTSVFSFLMQHSFPAACFLPVFLLY